MGSKSSSDTLHKICTLFRPVLQNHYKTFSSIITGRPSELFWLIDADSTLSRQLMVYFVLFNMTFVLDENKNVSKIMRGIRLWKKIDMYSAVSPKKWLREPANK